MNIKRALVISRLVNLLQYWLLLLPRLLKEKLIHFWITEMLLNIRVIKSILNNHIRFWLRSSVQVLFFNLSSFHINHRLIFEKAVCNFKCIIEKPLIDLFDLRVLLICWEVLGLVRVSRLLISEVVVLAVSVTTSVFAIHHVFEMMHHFMLGVLLFLHFFELEVFLKFEKCLVV